MEKIMINDENVIMYYGNKAGYVKADQATVDPMFRHEELVHFLTEENRFHVNWKEGVFNVLINNSAMDAIQLKSCRIHQLKPESDPRMKFIGYNDLIMQGFGKPNPANYQVVFDGGLDTNDLDSIYDKFNVDLPEDYKGHSLSMSDVIELYDDQESSFYYVDSVGFKEIEFIQPVQQQAPVQEQPANHAEYVPHNAEPQMESQPEEPMLSDQNDEEQEIYTFTL